MKTSRAMPFDIGDYLSDTMGLSRGDHASYFMLMCAYWKNGGPLPNNDDQLRHIAMCSPQEWSQTKDVMRRFFDTTNGCWRQKRLDIELCLDRQRQAAICRASQAGVDRRRELGQIGPAEPSDKPSVRPMDRISWERELGRIDKQLERLRGQGTTVATGTHYTVEQRQTMKALRERAEELRKLLGWKV